MWYTIVTFTQDQGGVEISAAKDDRFVIFNADDFGFSRRLNRAVIEAHREGILGSASLMVAEEAAEDAVALARACPELELGLHLSLCQGRAVLPPAEIPGLVSKGGRFSENPVWAGMKLFFGVWLKDQIRREMKAQLDRFVALVGRRPGHLNGHLNIHVHPTVLKIAVELAQDAGIPAIRLPREPAEVVLALDPRSKFSTRLNGVIFDQLSARAARAFREAGIAHTERCYGILRPLEMREGFVDGLLEQLGPGTTEIYLHPGHPGHGSDDPELATLRSERLRGRLAELGIGLTTYDAASAPKPVAVSAPADALAEAAR